MQESLWNAIDDHLKDNLLSTMGEHGIYPDLAIQSVQILATTDVSDWANMICPFQVIMSYQSRAVPAGHAGTDSRPREMEYLTTILSVVEGTPEECTRNARILAWRTEKLLAALRFNIAVTDGSKASSPKSGSRGALFATQVELYPKQSHAKSNLKYGVAVTGFSVPGTAL